MRIGEFEAEIISGGAFRLDGGGMFGVVPRPLWTRAFTPDDSGRILLEANCLLLRAHDETILIDTGNGVKFDEKSRAIYDLQPGEPLLEGLAANGVAANDITAILLTHLHMDHVGGASRWDSDGAPIAQFPRAQIFVQRLEWEDAVANRSHMRTTYRAENLAPLERSGRLVLLDGEAEPFPGVRARPAPGHTRGHQVWTIESGGDGAIFGGDVCPTTAHFRAAYQMAYDMEPYTNMQTKLALLAEAQAKGWLWLFDHEPQRRAVRVAREKDQFVPVPLC